LPGAAGSDEAVKLVGGTWIAPDAGKITFSEWVDQWSARQMWTTGTAESARQAAKLRAFPEGAVARHPVFSC